MYQASQIPLQMASSNNDEIYYTCQWTGPRSVTVSSLEYNKDTYTMAFSDGSILTLTGEIGTQGGADSCDPVVFFKWNEIFPSYTQDAHDSANGRIDAIAEEFAQITTFIISHDTTSGHNDLCDTTLYINTDSDDIPYFGFRSTHNGCYSHEINVSVTNPIGDVVFNKRFYL